MKKLLTLLLALAAACAAQTTFQYSLESTSTLCTPLPDGTLLVPFCPPAELWKAGVWVTIHNADPKVFGFYVAVSVTMADGSTSIQKQFVERTVGGSGDGYANAILWFGKMPSDFTLPPAKISVMDVPVGPAVEQASPAAGVEYRATREFRFTDSGTELLSFRRVVNNSNSKEPK